MDSTAPALKPQAGWPPGACAWAQPPCPGHPTRPQGPRHCQHRAFIPSLLAGRSTVSRPRQKNFVIICFQLW